MKPLVDVVQCPDWVRPAVQQIFGKVDDLSSGFVFFAGRQKLVDVKKSQLNGKSLPCGTSHNWFQN